MTLANVQVSCTAETLDDGTSRSIHRQVSTAALDSTIWSPTNEATFRQSAVDLALATSECPWDADVGLPPLHDSPQLVDLTVVSAPGTSSTSQYRLSEEVEHRLANDFAFIAATQEAVFSVTAACVEENADLDGNLTALTLRLAANEGIGTDLKHELLQLWKLLTTSQSDLQTTIQAVFEHVVSLNRSRILQRVRKAVGHPPIFREKGRTRTNPDDRLLRALNRMQKTKLTEVGQRLVERGMEANLALLRLLVDITPEETENPTPVILHRLRQISKQCFDVTTDGGRLPFKHILVESGLDAELWLKSKYIGEVDKVGAYWRIAKSLVNISERLHKQRPSHLKPLELRIEGIQPYVSVVREPSIQGRPMPCYVHAEIQLLCHYLITERSQADNDQASLNTKQNPPRVVGASKSACFLCYLCLKCCGGLKSPPTHGRLYDQWLIPDLVEFGPAQVRILRQTIELMNKTMLKLRIEYNRKRPRDHPMTSRTDVDRLSMHSAASEVVEFAQQEEPQLSEECRTHSTGAWPSTSAVGPESLRNTKEMPEQDNPGSMVGHIRRWVNSLVGRYLDRTK